MRRRLTRLAALAASLSALAGCGHSATKSAGFGLGQLPLASGARVAEQIRQCDRGASAFCALELVVVDPRLSSSGALVERERRVLRAHGWYQAVGDTGLEHAADSPGHRLRVTYGTALADLTGVGVGWIKRPHRFALALSRQVFARRPAMSVMLETGPA
jgi:hypothetical protein